MKQVTASKTEVLQRLIYNREVHRAQLEEALEGWHKAVIKELDKALKDARAGRKYINNFYLPQPQDHTEDYDTAIEMLKMEVADTVTLSQQEFQQLVQDNWNWKHDFLTTNAAYSGL